MRHAWELGTVLGGALLAGVLLAGCASGSADYPRLTAWWLESTATEDVTTLGIAAASGACIDIEGEEVGFEPLERVEVEETDTEVVVSAWLGEPETPRPHECAGVGIDIPAEVRLDEPLGDRELVDPACELPRYGQHAACHDEP